MKLLTKTKVIRISEMQNLTLKKMKFCNVNVGNSIREYERENGSRICFDERDSKEFLEIYKTGKD